MQLLKLLIWQKNGILRNFSFKENTVNVITGDSGRGKTSLIYIIDYCLLSSSASNISKKVIDEKVDWYGIVFKINNKTITIARQASHLNSNYIYYSEVGEVPGFPERKIELDSMKHILQKEFGINSNMKIPYGGRFIMAGSKISYRYFLSNCYQDQNTLIATNKLYMNYSDIKSQERIDRTFGMAIGVDNEASSIIKERLFSLENERDQLERRQKQIEKKAMKFNEEIFELYKEALNLNLVSKKFKSAEEAFTDLKNINKNLEKIKYDNQSFENLEKEIFKKEQEIRKLENFDKGYKDYITALQETLDTLNPIEYLAREGNQKLIKTDSLYPLLDSLEHGLEEVKKSILNKKTAKLIIETKEEKKEIEKEIKNLKKDRDKIQTTDIKSYQELYLYIGKLTAILDIYSEFENIDKLLEKIQKIKKKIFELQRELDDNNTLRITRLEILNEKINNYLDILTIRGYEEDKVLFDEKTKTLNILRKKSSKVEYMEDIGSQSNYLNLHLSYFLSLHEIARENNLKWMPSFLILDQVNSPYYDSNTQKISNDKERFDETLKVLNDYVNKMSKYGFQIILLEHIEEAYWKKLGLENFNLVGKELRDDEGLIIK